VTGIWNFAQPGLMTISFYVIYWGVNVLKLPAYAAFCLSLVITIVCGLGVEKLAFQTLRNRKALGFTFFIFTLIVSEFAAYLITLLFGTEPFTVFPYIFSPVTPYAGIIISQWDIQAIFMTAIVIAAVYGLLRWTKPGKFMTAVANNSRLAELYGISSANAYAMSICAVAILSTFGMYILGTKIAVTPHFSLGIIIFAVAATVMGGIGNVFGAAMAAIVLSLVQGFSVLVIPSQWQNLLLYIFFFIIIIFMPSGFGQFVRVLRGKSG
jgi:branched-subunit amino acid ABC-type transport system permease component